MDFYERNYLYVLFIEKNNILLDKMRYNIIVLKVLYYKILLKTIILIIIGVWERIDSISMSLIWAMS